MSEIQQPELVPHRAETNSTGEVKTNGRSGAGHYNPSINLHIGELVLHGFEAVDRYTIGGTLGHELTRLISEHGLPRRMPQDVNVDHMNFGVIHARPGAKAEATGVQLARAIYRGLTK